MGTDDDNASLTSESLRYNETEHGDDTDLEETEVVQNASIIMEAGKCRCGGRWREVPGHQRGEFEPLDAVTLCFLNIITSVLPIAVAC